MPKLKINFLVAYYTYQKSLVKIKYATEYFALVYGAQNFINLCKEDRYTRISPLRSL